MPSKLTQCQQKQGRWRLLTRLNRPPVNYMQKTACWAVRATALLELWCRSALRRTLMTRGWRKVAFA